MRCKNCGWENHVGEKKCIKCNAPLTENRDVEDLKKTKRDADSKKKDDNTNTCIHCGYPISSINSTSCPNCANNLHNQPQNDKKTKACPKCGAEVTAKDNFCNTCGTQLRMGTENPWNNPQQKISCSLKPLSRTDENIEYPHISYSGNMIILNRANTEPNNHTITSNEQAILINEEDSWYIEDRSEQKTTFVHAGKKMKIEDGDIIVLGNRLFKFKS